ncbi:MAG: alpha-amylase family glycosyl hydrolase, partial [Marinobacter sp.]|nr:alpha-amylase family glycosyl hydrolase [Marinobacter sp.]
MTSELETKLSGMLDLVYPDVDTVFLANELIDVMGLSRDMPGPSAHRNNWDEQDVLLITYADSIRRDDEKPLVTLHRFLQQRLQKTLTAVHLLPFFPFSSDDGFSVMDYLAVNESHGRWEDIERIAGDFKLMADLVINHRSARSRWFENFKKRVDPGRNYFLEASPDEDLSA